MSDRGPHRDDECCFYATGCERFSQAAEVTAALRSQLSSIQGRLSEAQDLAARLDAQLETQSRQHTEREASVRARVEAVERERDVKEAERAASSEAYVSAATNLTRVLREKLAAEAARDAAISEVAVLRRALGDIEEYEIDWARGTGENMAAVQNMAVAALNRALLASLPTPGPATGRTITVRHYDLLGELNVEQVMGIPRDENLWAEIRVSRGHETGTLDVISEIRPESYREPTPGPAEPTGSPSEARLRREACERHRESTQQDALCPDCQPSEPVKP